MIIQVALGIVLGFFIIAAIINFWETVSSLIVWAIILAIIIIAGLFAYEYRANIFEFIGVCLFIAIGYFAILFSGFGIANKVRWVREKIEYKRTDDENSPIGTFCFIGLFNAFAGLCISLLLHLNDPQSFAFMFAFAFWPYLFLTHELRGKRKWATDTVIIPPEEKAPTPKSRG